MQSDAGTMTIESLQAELEQARETNRRLNRRCQSLESELLRQPGKYAAIIRDASNNAARLCAYANQLRDEWRQTKNSIHASYKQHWQRLPKPATGYDGMKARVDEALRLIDLQKDKTE